MTKKILFTALIIFIIIPCSLAYSSTFLQVKPKKLTMGIIGSSDYEKGYKETISANSIQLRDANNDWKLMVKTNDNDMGVVGGYTKPISDFFWRATGSYATQLAYTEITNYDVEAARGSRTSKKLDVFSDFKILLAWSRDAPGYYNISLLYTLTTQ